jgi:glucosamine-6-phosphate deaminase
LQQRLKPDKLENQTNSHEEELMRLIMRQSEKDAAEWTANYIARRIKDFSVPGLKPFVLGLPTGSTPVRIYEALVGKHKAGLVSFKGVTTFNMDEYVGLAQDHPQSYHKFMDDHFFSHVDIAKEHIHILNGCADDLDAECAAYEEAIKKAGGIELFLGGVGEDGHIAFNEPGSSLASRTRAIALTQETREVNARFFSRVDEVPAEALSVGVGTVMDAREVVIVAAGKRKARAVAACVEGPVTQMCTASCLQMHPNATLVCDEAAVAELKYGTVQYYMEAEKRCT